MKITMQNPKVGEAMLTWFLETWFFALRQAHAKGPIHVPSPEARRLPALFQMKSGEQYFQVFSNMVGASDLENRLIAVLRTKPVGSGFHEGVETPTYAWQYFTHAGDRVLVIGGTVLPVRTQPEQRVIAPLLLWNFEWLHVKLNHSCVRIADAEPDAHAVVLPQLLGVEVEKSEFFVHANFRVGTDMDRTRLLAVLRTVPKAMARSYGMEKRETTWAFHVLDRSQVLVVNRKIFSASTAVHRIGGHT